jgi:hypothetical protein
MRGIFQRFFVDLLRGDPVALIVAAVLAGIALLFGLVWWKTAYDLHREDEERKRRYGKAKRKP